MAGGIKVLGVSGSMHEGSSSGRALAIALESAIKHGAETRLLDLLKLDLPMFRPDHRSEASTVKEMIAAVNWADAYILATPDYHGGMSGAMKNFLDYHWKELSGKLFGYICSSHEKGLTAMDQLRTTIRQCYGWSLPYGATINSSSDFDKEGNLLNEGIAKRLRMLGRDVTVYGELLIERYRNDIADNVPQTFAGHIK